MENENLNRVAELAYFSLIRLSVIDEAKEPPLFRHHNPSPNDGHNNAK